MFGAPLSLLPLAVTQALVCNGSQYAVFEGAVPVGGTATATYNTVLYNTALPMAY